MKRLKNMFSSSKKEDKEPEGEYSPLGLGGNKSSKKPNFMTAKKKKKSFAEALNN
jgi:hypothetical protein